MTADLFDSLADRPDGTAAPVPLAPGAWWLPGFARADAPALLEAIGSIAAAAPFRHPLTPGGQRMSVAMTHCGRLGWVSDRRGYRYQPTDPLSGQPWPELPALWARLAAAAAAAVGQDLRRVPDACLVNRYDTGTRLGLHQDRDELDLSAPIVSVSLGVPAVFLLGGLQRRDPTQRLRLAHGDVVVWGGASRLAHHGVLPIAAASHPLTGSRRYNLTFRTVG